MKSQTGSILPTQKHKKIFSEFCTDFLIKETVFSKLVHKKQLWWAFYNENLLDEPKHLQDNFSDIHERNGRSKICLLLCNNFQNRELLLIGLKHGEKCFFNVLGILFLYCIRHDYISSTQHSFFPFEVKEWIKPAFHLLLYFPSPSLLSIIFVSIQDWWDPALWSMGPGFCKNW
jgi:hypothetical protein